MSEWIYFIHPPREDFAETMTEAEQAVWSEHFARLQRLIADGVLILAGPTFGRVNTASRSSKRQTNRPHGRSWRKTL